MLAAAAGAAQARLTRCQSRRLRRKFEPGGDAVALHGLGRRAPWPLARAPETGPIRPAPFRAPRNDDRRVHDMALEPASGGRILTADRRGSVACRACTSTSACMCTKTPLPCARQRFRMSLAALRLHHGRRSGDAVPEGAAVAGATPPSGCLVRHREGFQRRCQAADHPVRRPSSRCVGATAKDPGGELGTGPTVGGTAPATGNGGP